MPTQSQLLGVLRILKAEREAFCSGQGVMPTHRWWHNKGNDIINLVSHLHHTHLTMRVYGHSMSPRVLMVSKEGRWRRTHPIPFSWPFPQQSGNLLIYSSIFSFFFKGKTLLYYYYFFKWSLINLPIMLVSGVWQSDSVIHTHTHTHICIFRFFSLVGYYRILNIVPCAVQ